MTENAWLARWAEEPYAYLTTIGRRSGQPHRIEIWFAVHHDRILMMAGGRDHSDWVRNLMQNPRVSVELGDEMHDGMAHVPEEGTDDDRRAREMLVAKYATSREPLDDWKRRSLAVVITFANNEEVLYANE